MKTIERYVFKECVWSSTGVVLVLLMILLGNTLMRVLGDIADGKLPADSLWVMLVVNLVHYLVVLMPIGVYLGVMLGMGRFYRDSEMAAMSACGIGSARLYNGILALALPATFATLLLSTWLAPWTAGLQDAIRHKAKYASQLTGLTAGQFNRTGEDGQTLFFERWNASGNEIRNVFLRSGDAGQTIVQTADRAEVQKRGEDYYVVFKHGRAYGGEPGQQDYRLIEFARQGVLIRHKPAPMLTLRTTSTPTAKLLASRQPWMRAEWHWRLSAPVMCLLLALLALPLSDSAPRKGRFNRIGIGLLVYLIYTNLLGLGNAWIEHGAVSSALGLWWVHGLALLGTSLLIMRRERRLLFAPRRNML